MDTATKTNDMGSRTPALKKLVKPSLKPRHPKRLAWVIACGYLIPMLLTLTLMGIILHRHISEHLWESAADRLLHDTFGAIGVSNYDAASEQISEQLWANMAGLTPFSLIAALDEANLSARVIDMRGQIICQDGYLVEKMPLPAQEQFAHAKLLDTYTAPYAIFWIGRDVSGVSHFNALMPISLNGFPDVFVQIFAPWKYAEDVDANIRRIFLLSALGSLLVSVIISLLIGKHLSRPLRRLALTANQIKAGDLSARTDIQCNQIEIQQAAQSFDQMADQLERSFATQKRFVADASHELKTPLTSISGMAELLEDADDEDERQLAITVMNREIARMSRLVNDLLLLSRAENSQTSLQSTPENCDIYALLQEVRSSAQAAKTDKPIILADDPQITVKAGRDQLARIFHNLLENAQKYVPDTTPIEIAFHNKNGFIEVKVRDHGSGVPEKDLPRIFERFFRSDASRNRKTGGSGLGLSIVQALTEATGGRTYMRNHPEGGLEVTVILPTVSTGSSVKTIAKDCRHS